MGGESKDICVRLTRVELITISPRFAPLDEGVEVAEGDFGRGKVADEARIRIS
jgi:hypothetical protein